MLSIRTQNRMALVPYDRPISIHEDFNLYEISMGYPLGYYATKERALEVLDEIEVYVNKRSYEKGLGYKDIKDNVYQMPKE